MARFCTNCGKEIADGVAFCTECGTKAPELTSAPPPQAVPKPQTQVPQPQYTQPIPQGQPVYANQAPLEAEGARKKDFVGTAYYFFMMLVYAIPILGFIICLATAFSGENKSKKSFSRAYLLWMIIGLIFTVFAVVALIAIGKQLIDYVNAQLGENGLGDLSGLLEQFKQTNP